MTLSLKKHFFGDFNLLTYSLTRNNRENRGENSDQKHVGPFFTYVAFYIVFIERRWVERTRIYVTDPRRLRLCLFCRQGHGATRTSQLL